MAQNSKFTHQFPLDLSKTIKIPGKPAKRETLGTVSIPLPVLGDFGIQTKQAVYSAEDVAEVNDGKKRYPNAVIGAPKYDDGVPVFEDTNLDWLQQAVVKAVAAKSRNYFQKGSLALKQGQSLCEDFESLTADSLRTGDAMKMRKEAVVSFEAYLAKVGKKAQTVQLLSNLFYQSSKVLATAGDTYVEALSSYVSDWIDQLDDAGKARFTPKISELQESLNAAQSGEGLDEDDVTYKAPAAPVTA